MHASHIDASTLFLIRILRCILWRLIRCFIANRKLQWKSVEASVFLALALFHPNDVFWPWILYLTSQRTKERLTIALTEIHRKITYSQSEFRVRLWPLVVLTFDLIIKIKPAHLWMRLRKHIKQDGNFIPAVLELCYRIHKEMRTNGQTDRRTACKHNASHHVGKTYVVTRTYSTFGDKAFAAAGPGL